MAQFDKIINKIPHNFPLRLVLSYSIGIIGIIGFTYSVCKKDLTIVYIALLISLACYISGFFIGILFGMPKRNYLSDTDYTLNNSLEEISDWVTKIITGLGLINLKQIPSYLVHFGNYVSDSMSQNIKNININILANSILIYYSVLGLYFGYNHIRLVLSGKYKNADDNLLMKKIKTYINDNNNNSIQIIPAATDRYIIEMKEKAIEKLNSGSIQNPIDQQKGQWGNQKQSNDKILDAVVKEYMDGLYQINLTVKSLNPANPLINGETVLFALHKTFGNPPFRYVNVVNGIAELNLTSYGSFTVGVLCDKGATELELDLAELPNVSQYFKEH